MRSKLKAIDDDFIYEGEEQIKIREKLDHDDFEPTFMYLGRLVNKRHFRAFVYAVDGRYIVVNSYAEFKKNVESGEWFESEEAAQEISKKEHDFFADIADDIKVEQKDEEIVPDEVKPARKNYNRKKKTEPKKEEQPDLPIIADVEGEVIDYGADR